MSQELQERLGANGFDDLYDVFAAEDIDASMLPDLSDSDLRELGLTLGQRKRFIAAFNEPAPRPEARATVPAERRQLTVAFCDLVGSTSLSTVLDPEDLREVITAYIDTAVATMTAHGGHLAYTQGDGLMVYFGYPVAQEDDPARAIRAAMATVASVRGLDTSAPGELNVRIGVATGRVVVGDMAGDSSAPQDFVVGETPNLAARLQALAAPGEVIVAGETQHLAAGAFEFEPRGAVEVKGFDAPRPVFAVMREVTGRSRFETRASDGVQPMVGREAELDMLSGMWEAVRGGAGRICLIEGPPGIGKSRLLRAIHSRAGGAAVEWQCVPHLSNRALHPMIAELERDAGIKRRDTIEARREKAAGLVERAAGLDAADLPHLASLVGAPFDDEEQADAQERARRMLDMLFRRVDGAAGGQPALVILEDAHWADPTTLEFVDHIAGRIGELPVLLVMTCRPEFEASGSLGSAGARLPLQPLDPDAGIALVANVSGARVLPAVLARRIIEKTDGVPLFVEELTKSILDTIPGDGIVTADMLDEMDIPATLQDSLMSRLDRTGAAKEVAQLGAVIGREFTAAMVRAIAPQGTDVDAALRRLEDAELVHRGGLSGPDHFVFNHALVQDTAYESMLRSRRRDVHLALARAMLDGDPAFGIQEPEIIARHCEHGGLTDEAIAQWIVAGQEAVGRAANLAAVNYLRSALRLLMTKPESGDRDGTELGLQMMLAAACMSSFGWGSDTVEQAATRAQALAQELGNGEALFGATWIRWTFYFLGGRMREALEVAHTIRQMADAAPSGLSRVAAAHALLYTHYSRGEMRAALDALEWGVPAFDLEIDRQMLPAFQLGSGNALFSLGANVYWLLGEEAESEAARARALEISAALEHAPNRAQSLFVSSYSLMFSRQWTRLRETALMARQIAEENNLLLWIPMCDAYLAVAEIGEGDPEKGTALLDPALAGVRALGTMLTLSQFQFCAADGLMRAGLPRQALERLESISEDAYAREERLLWSEYLRVRGEALCALDLREEGLNSLREAADDARSSGAAALLARAEKSLVAHGAERFVS